MKTFLFAAFFLGLGACAQQAPAPLQGEALVTRGDYLVNGIGGCNDCHTPMTPQGPDMSHALQGATLIVAPTIEIPWAPVAPAIAGGPAGYTNEQFVAWSWRSRCSA